MPEPFAEVPADDPGRYSVFAFSDCLVQIIWIERSGSPLRKQIVAYEPEPVGEKDTPAKQ